MANLSAKKQEEWNAKQLKELLLQPENKKCFDCPTKSPFFVNISIQTFVCARCSGLVREVGHRVKSISASKFSGPEIVALQYGGNKVAGSIWLSTFHSSTPEPETDSDVRMFMRQKYYEQKWLDRSKAIEHSEKVKKIVMEMFLEDGTRRNSTGGSTRAQLSPTSPTSSFVPLPRNSLDSNRTSILAPPPTKQQSLDVTTNRTSALIPPPTKQSTESSRPKIVPTQSWVDDNTPIGLIPAVKSMVVNNLLLDEDLLGDHTTSLPGSPQSSTSINRQNDFVLPKKPQVPLTVKSDIFSDLAELNPIKPIKSPTYSGGILQPNSPGNSSNIVSPRSINNNTIQPSPTNTTKPIDLDPYAALRGLSFGGK